MTDGATILVVDDQPQNLRLLDAILTPRGFDVRTADSGEEALRTIEAGDVDLVLLDIVMPVMDGYEVCRRVRGQADTAYLPVVMLTASGDEQKVKALEAGADDFLTKPIDQNELLARVASLARIKRYQDTINRQADQLAEWNRDLEERVATQVSQLQRMERLRRFLPPQLAELIVDSGDESFLESHRREIVVIFCDLRGFTTFAESSEPEEVMGVLEEYHQALGDLIFRFEGTLERFAGDGLMVFFNDPVRCEDGPLRAVRMAVAMRTGSTGSPRSGRVKATTSEWESVSPRATRRSAKSASMDATTTQQSEASPTSPRGCVRVLLGGRSSSPSGYSPQLARSSSETTQACGNCAGSAGRSTPSP